MNTARGSLVEESALANALKVRKEILKRQSREHEINVLDPDPWDLSLCCADPDPSVNKQKKLKKT